MDKTNSIDLKTAIHTQLWGIYSRKGYTTMVTASWELMKVCEKRAKEHAYRQLKGEIAEIVLECGLRELQKTVKPSITLKGLCIPFRSIPGKTTELDLVFVTERCIYLFECKSYKNRPTLTGDCMLGDSMDVYSQSKYHLKGLHEYIGRLYNHNRTKTPYKFILFEMSSQGVLDKRTPEAKKRVPVCSPQDFITIFEDDFKHQPHGVWNIDEVVRVLEPLSHASQDMFVKHVARLSGKK